MAIDQVKNRERFRKALRVLMHLFLWPAIGCLLGFAVVQLLGLRRHTSVVIGAGDFSGQSGMLGMIYLFFYAFAYLLAPVLLMAAGFLKIIVISTRHAPGP